MEVDTQMNLCKYLLELYKEQTGGASNYAEGSQDDNFQDDLSDFFDRLLIYTSDIKDLANQCGADIITAAMQQMAAQQLNPTDYIDLGSFISLAFSSIEEEYYNTFKNVFLNN